MRQREPRRSEGPTRPPRKSSGGACEYMSGAPVVTTKTVQQRAPGIIVPPATGPMSDMPGLTPENAAAWVDDKVAKLQEEIDALNTEIRALRRRDETINYYMQRVDEE